MRSARPDQRKPSSRFSLVELVGIVAILAIVAAIVVPRLRAQHAAPVAAAAATIPLDQAPANSDGEPPANSEE